MGGPTQNQHSTTVTGKLLDSSLSLHKTEIKSDCPLSDILLGLILTDFLAITVLIMYKELQAKNLG